ncbi:MAG: tRNA (adenosine(37)-N6)-dimethylallyltransferase MiaA [Dehalococcoidales bacterium]|jgi:tRNA dimethylallyltransferase
MDNKLLAVVGPTATGKSELALRLARKFDGEIVSADSRQVYRHLDIGTAKPSGGMVALVPHHLFSIIDPDESFSLAEYQMLAYQSVADIQEHNHLPLLVGGSGQYVWAVLEGWQIPRVPPDTAYRHELEMAAENDKDSLYRKLLEIAPEAGAKIDRRNVRRVIRALEVHQNPEMNPVNKPRRKETPFKTIIIGLTAPRAELYHRIDQRVERMVADGLVEEVARLMKMGYQGQLPALSGIGYRQIIQHLTGEVSLPVAIQQIKSDTHRYVRQQYNWFRLQDERIRWFNICEKPENAIEELVDRFLEE